MNARNRSAVATRATGSQVAAGAAPERAGYAYRDMDLLRFTTAGSVDDGKSTLIGRLLYDTKAIFEDQLEAIHLASRRRGEHALDLALLTDGLRAEREQKITIDVAYRYFATPRRKFIIADTPGHVQYTRNMVTGASTADLAIVLVDARRGVVTQSKRHGFIASLLGIPHVLVAINKMDLVDWSEDVYRRIAEEYGDFAHKLDVQNVVFIPISALLGDNVVERSRNMPWYDGATLLHHLETVNVGADRNLLDFRFPVQYVVRPHQGFRGYAGKVLSGTIRPGEEVVALPSGQPTRVREVVVFQGALEEATAGDSVVITLEDELDVSRGDMIVRRNNVPAVRTRFEAMLCWMGDAPLNPDMSYVLLHTTRQVNARVMRLLYRIDVDTLHREHAETLQLNEIGRVELTVAQPVFFDPYRVNRATGSFVLVDPFTHVTVAAGMIREVARAELPEPAQRPVSPNVVPEDAGVPREERELRNGHGAAVVWLTGLSGSGKSTIARLLERRLFELDCQTALLDGDGLRHGLCGDLRFSAADRHENIRRAGEVARLLFESGAIVICPFVSPFRADRARVRSLLPEGRFVEVHVACDLDECRRRDPKGLYARAERGEIPEFTGVTSPYEAPEQAEVVLDTTRLAAEQAVEIIVEELCRRGLLPASRGA